MSYRRARPGGALTPTSTRSGGQLAEYFAGTRMDFELTLNPAGTPFQLTVWSALREIPYGATASYGKIAAAIGRPDAARAVGWANGQNPIPIIVPCHRVIGADGSLTGYGGGLPAKRWLLAHEAGARRAHPAVVHLMILDLLPPSDDKSKISRERACGGGEGL